MEPELIREIASSFFLYHPTFNELKTREPENEVMSQFAKTEVKWTEVHTFKNKNKMPGTDNIPRKIWTVVHMTRPINLCAINGCPSNISGQWKRTLLALLLKPGKPEGLPSSYRPYCLLNDVGKIFEQLIVKRMENHMTNAGSDFSERQFSFRIDRSTDDFMRLLHNQIVGVYNDRHPASVVGIDILNAFNTIW